MAGPSLYLYEWLYRGRSPGSSEPAAYHVQLAQDSTDPFGKTQTTVYPAMTPEQAKSLGFDMPDIASAINADAIVQVGALTAELATANDGLATARATIAELQAQLAAAQAASAPSPDPAPATA